MASYTRQSTFTDGDTIFAALLNNEYDQLAAAFNVSSGHTHDGATAGDGGPISKLFSNAITFGTNVNADVVVTFDATSNDGVLSWMEDEDYFQFSDDILLSTDEKILFRDSAIYINSSADGQLDLVADTEIQIAATTIDINGNTEISGSLTLGSSTAVSSVLDEDNMASDSATALATQQSIKAYVDAVTASVNAQDLDFQGDSGGALNIDLDTETLTIAGGTGIDTVGSGNTLTISIDGTVVTGSSTDTFTNKTIDANGTGNSITNLEVADFASGVLDTDITSVSSSDDTLASAKAIKDYVDTQVATVPTGDITSVTAGTGLSGGGTTGAVTLDIDTATTVDLSTSQALSNKTLTSPVINTGVSGSAILDEDNFASDSDTKLATQQSIKAYVASQVATANELSELTDTNITSAADGALLFYDTATSKWIDNVVSGDITIADTGVATIAAGVVVNDDINSSAAIDATKIHDGSVTNTEFGYIGVLTSDAQTQIDSKQATIDASNRLNANLINDGSVDNTEFGYLNGVTSAIQTQIDNKQATIDASNRLNANLIHDGSVDNTEFGYLNGVTSSLQTQIDNKQATIDASNRLNANLIHDGSVDNTEFGYLNGVTSAIQTQLDAKATNGFSIAMAIAL